MRLSQAATALDASVDALLDLAAALPHAASPQPSETDVPAQPGAPFDWRHFEPLSLDPALSAALSAFLERGYHGSPVREIAQRAGLSVPGIYHHYPSKQHMLVAILELTMNDLLRRAQAARLEGRDAVERFCLLVECLALFHTHRRELGFVGASEMRSLVPDQRAHVVAARRQQQRMVDEEVEQACADGMFRIDRPHEASRAIVTMCTALPQWFDGRGAATADEVAAQYVTFALDLMRCTRRRTAPIRRERTR